MKNVGRSVVFAALVICFFIVAGVTCASVLSQNAEGNSAGITRFNIAYDSSSVRINSTEEFLYIARCINDGKDISVTNADMSVTNINSQDVNILLQSDIELCGEIIPLGSEEFPFKGSFDGNGYTVYLHGIEQLFSCLFGYVSNAVFRNFVVSGELSGERAALFGYAEDLTIESGSIDLEYKSSRVGGIVAESKGDARICNTNITLSVSALDGKFGGIALKAQNLTLNNCNIELNIGLLDHTFESVAAGIALESEYVKLKGVNLYGELKANKCFTLLCSAERLDMQGVRTDVLMSCSSGFTIGSCKDIIMLDTDIEQTVGIIDSADRLYVKNSFFVLNGCERAFGNVRKAAIIDSYLYFTTQKCFNMFDSVSIINVYGLDIDGDCNQALLFGEEVESLTLKQCDISVKADSQVELCREVENVRLLGCNVELSGNVHLFYIVRLFEARNCRIKAEGEENACVIGRLLDKASFYDCRLILISDSGVCSPVALSEGEVLFNSTNVLLEAQNSDVGGFVFENCGKLNVVKSRTAIYALMGKTAGGVVGISRRGNISVTDSQVSGSVESSVFGGIAGIATDSDINVKGTVFAATPVAGRQAALMNGLLFGNISGGRFFNENSFVCSYASEGIGFLGGVVEDSPIDSELLKAMRVGWVDMRQRLIYNGKSLTVDTGGGLSLRDEINIVDAGEYELLFDTADGRELSIILDIYLPQYGRVQDKLERKVMYGEELPSVMEHSEIPIRNVDSLKLYVTYYDEKGVRVRRVTMAGSYTFVARSREFGVDFTLCGSLSIDQATEYILPYISELQSSKTYDGQAVNCKVYAPDENIALRLLYEGTTVSGRKYSSYLPPKEAGKYTVSLYADMKGFYKGMGDDRLVDKRDFEIIPAKVVITAICESVPYTDTPEWEWVVEYAENLDSLAFIPGFATLKLILPDQPDQPAEYWIMPEGELGGDKYSVSFLPVRVVFTKRTPLPPTAFPELKYVNGGIKAQLPDGCEWAIDRDADYTSSGFIPDVTEGKHTLYLRYYETKKAYSSPSISKEIEVKYSPLENALFYVGCIVAAGVSVLIINHFIRKKREQKYYRNRYKRN